MFGLLNINKPSGITSRDVVNRVQRIVKPVKVGHAGTLDPLATGVLVVCVGPATRLIDYVQRREKRYVGTFLLGRQSDTEDVTGETVELVEPPEPTRDELAAALPRFIGDIEQTPPAFSAVKVKGRRAYKLARQGKRVELHPRTITVYDIELLDYAYPEFTLDITCGSGTYVRSLGRDIARSLGTEAVMSALSRTAIGEFRIEDSIDSRSLTEESIGGHLLPAIQAVAHLPSIELTPDEAARIANGLAVENRNGLDGEVAAKDSAGQLISILVVSDGQLRPRLNFGTSPVH